MSQSKLAGLMALCVLTLGAGAMADGEEFATAASWIWYPERPSVEGAGQTRYLRKVVRLAGKPKTARLRLLVDDGLSFTVNGQPLEPEEQVSCGGVYDLTNVLVAGENVLGFAVHNAGGPGGLIVKGVVVDADGTEHPILSDTTFRASRQPEPGWDQPGFDDSAWPPAAIVGNAFAQPWYGHPAFDLEPFLDPDELDRYRKWREHLVALPPGLAAERDAEAKIGYANGRAAIFINGTARPALIYRGTVDPLTAHGRRQISLFRDAGVHVYCAYWELAQCWPRPGAYDFEALDDCLRAYLSVDPEAYLVLILRLVPPPWWMDTHPEEMVRYAAGDDYNSSDECLRVMRPSLASTAWRRDMMALWRQCIEHIETQPWGKRVIGYQPGYGIYTEWHYFGSWTNQMPDTGPAMTAHFRQWLRQRYGTPERLRKAWGDPAITFDAVQVPGVQERRAADALGLRDPARRRPVMDYYLCQQQLTADCIEDFCRTAKEITHGRAICGAFYGYWHGVPPQTQGGHLELPRLLASPYVDYFAAPYDYSHRLMGQDGRLRCLPEAFPVAGKVHMVEADTRTHLHPVDEHGRVPDEASSIAAIRRELSTALIAGSALWWCDFGADGTGGWYDHPALIGEVTKLMALASRLLEQPKRPVARVAVVCDPASMYLLPDAEAMQTHYELLEAVTTELYKTGAPFDSLLLSQLSTADLSRYRLLIFLDTLLMDQATRAAVKAATSNKAALWLWAPGISDGQRLNEDLVRDVTGFRVALRGHGVSAARAVAVGTDPLVARLPAKTVRELKPTQTAPLAEAWRPDNWYNPRDAETMAQHYRAFEWDAEEGLLRWRFATDQGWTDIHLQATIPACDGLRLTISGEGAAVGSSLRVVIKDAQEAEFVTERRRVVGEPQELCFAIGDFGPAPWRPPDVPAPRMPMKGLKLVLDGLSNAEGTLLVRNLEAVWGKVVEHEERGYDSPAGEHPCLVIDDPGVTPLAQEPRTGDVVLAARAVGGGARHVLSTLPYVPRDLLVALMEEAGVHRYLESPDVILRADGSLIALHTAKEGEYILSLPRRAKVSDALSGEQIAEGTSVTIHLAAPSTTLLELR